MCLDIHVAHCRNLQDDTPSLARALTGNRKSCRSGESFVGTCLDSGVHVGLELASSAVAAGHVLHMKTGGKGTLDVSTGKGT